MQTANIHFCYQICQTFASVFRQHYHMKNIFRITGKGKFGFVKNYAILLTYNVFCFYKAVLKRTSNNTSMKQKSVSKVFQSDKNVITKLSCGKLYLQS